jgi:hypothetical protein
LSQDLFQPERLARGMLAIEPEYAAEIVMAFLDDALATGNRERAFLWFDVLGRIERAQNRAFMRPNTPPH